MKKQSTHPILRAHLEDVLISKIIREEEEFRLNTVNDKPRFFKKLCIFSFFLVVIFTYTNTAQANLYDAKKRLKPKLLELCVGSSKCSYIQENMQVNTNNKKYFFQNYFCQYMQGDLNVGFNDGGSVGCLTYKYAIEADRIDNWQLAFSDSLYFAAKSDRRPAVLLILNSEHQKYYLKKISLINRKYKTNVKIWTIIYSNSKFTVRTYN